MLELDQVIDAIMNGSVPEAFKEILGENRMSGGITTSGPAFDSNKAELAEASEQVDHLAGAELVALIDNDINMANGTPKLSGGFALIKVGSAIGLASEVGLLILTENQQKSLFEAVKTFKTI